MQFSRFLTGLIEHGRALVSEQDPIWDDAALDLLKEIDVAVRANLGSTAPAFQLAPAQWAGEIIYYACQACVCRHIDQEKVKEHLRRPCPEKRHSHDVIYSADLLLRYLPNVWQLAKRIAPDDPLVQELRALGTEWPLSSVGIAGIENADTTPFADDPSLMTLYVDRIMAANDHSRITEGPVRLQIGRAIGAHRELYPELSAHFTEIGTV
jgi:hypothetical protein